MHKILFRYLFIIMNDNIFTGETNWIIVDQIKHKRYVVSSFLCMTAKFLYN